jgi:hypothetical protein
VSSQPVVVISALTYTPQTDEFNLFFRMQQENFDNQSVRPFLLDLITLLPRKPVFLLDPTFDTPSVQFYPFSVGRFR